jgi:hypothetical protein
MNDLIRNGLDLLIYFCLKKIESALFLKLK